MGSSIVNWRVALTSMNGGFPVGIGSVATLNKGVRVPQFITIDGQRGQLLLANDGSYLTGADGAPLYGRAA